MPAKRAKLKKKKSFVRNVLFALGGFFIVLLVINLFVDLNPKWQELQIMAAARGNNQSNEINGIKVNFVFGKQMGEYAIVRAVPIHNETDPLQIILQKVRGKWKVIDSGTAFPDLEGKVPSGLFSTP